MLFFFQETARHQHKIFGAQYTTDFEVCFDLNRKYRPIYRDIYDILKYNRYFVILQWYFAKLTDFDHIA